MLAFIHEHHDFSLASWHPPANVALSRFATKYAMPARIWRHGVHFSTGSPDTIDLQAAFAFSNTKKQPTRVQTVRRPHNDAAKKHTIQTSSVSSHFPFPINLLLPLSQLTRKPRKSVSVFQVRGNLDVSLFLFLDTVVDLPLRWDVLSVTRRVSSCYHFVGTFSVRNGIAGAGVFFCAVHSGKAKISERGSEGLLRAMYCTFVCFLRNRSAVVFGVGSRVLGSGDAGSLLMMYMQSDSMVQC